MHMPRLAADQLRRGEVCRLFRQLIFGNIFLGAIVVGLEAFEIADSSVFTYATAIMYW